jgi:MIP family channel proteins
MTDYLVKAIATEFAGSFCLVLTAAGAVALTAAQGGSLVGSAFAYGIAYMALIYAWGNYSGAHFNPAISFGHAVAGRMNWGLMIGYWIAQLLGGIAAAALIAYLYGTDSGVGATIGSLTTSEPWKAILLEALLTFILVITVLLVTKNPLLAVSSGLAIGLVLTANMLAGAPLTGASMNPARSLGPAIFAKQMGTYWVYVVGPLLGALAAGLVYRLFTTDFSAHPKVDECGVVIKDACGKPIIEASRPVLDCCGKPIIDECGVRQMETYIKHDHHYNHHQAVPHHLHALGEWCIEQGLDLSSLKSHVEKTVPVISVAM